MLVLHLCSDGQVSHVSFSQGAWESAMADASIARFWAHAPGDCVDPRAEHWARLRRHGFALGVAQHAWADEFDPSWVGSRKEVLAACQEPAQHIPWPPPACDNDFLEVQFQALMMGTCIDDARALRWGTRPEMPPELPPPADQNGQFLMF